MSCRICDSIVASESPELNEALVCLENGNYAHALELALPAAHKGEAIAQCLLGGLYLNGLGVKIDSQVAVGWLEQAGEQGCGPAWHNLSILYLTGGDGIEPDQEAALRYRQRAIENGFDFVGQFSRAWTSCYEELLR